MQRHRAIVPTTSAALCAVAIGSAAAGMGPSNRIVNGSFELFTIPGNSWNMPGSFDNFTAGKGALPGWETVEGMFTYGLHPWRNAAEGNASIDLAAITADVTSLGLIRQDVATTPGQPYRLTFDIGTDTASPQVPQAGPLFKEARVGVGAEFYVFGVDGKGYQLPDVPWRAESITFIAVASTTTISFEGLTPGYANITIDDVRLFESCGDLSGDGFVGSEDLNILLAAFGGGAAGDVDADGQTNSADLNILLGSFGQHCG